MALEANAIMLAVDDLDRSKRFYTDLGCAVDQDYPNFVRLSMGDRSSMLALYPRESAAQDAGVSSEGTGYRGVSFHYLVASKDAVDQVIRDAVDAGGEIVRKPEAAQWGYFGYFSDPDGYLWKVAASS